MEEEEENNTNKNQCPYCDKQYGRKNHVLRHIETEHEVHNDIYKCPHCSRSFNRHDKWMHHVQVHSEPGYSCDICNQKFSRKEHLVRHMELDHRVAEDSTEGAGKNKICEYCGSTFARKDHLGRHIKQVHAPEETHKCGKCGQSFITKDNLRKHLYNHKIEKGKAGAAPPKKRRKIEQIHYKCNYCGNVHDSEQGLRDHIKTHLDDDQDLVQEGVELENALKGAMKVVTFIPKGVQKADLPRFFSDVKPVIAKSLKKEMLRTRGVRWFTVSTIEFFRTIITEEKKEETATTQAYISCSTQILLPGHNDEDLDKAINDAVHNMYINFYNFKDL